MSNAHPDVMKSPYLKGSIVEGPVGLLLVDKGTQSNAMTISCFSELAHYPTSLWVSVDRTTYTHSLLEQVGHFSLAVLNIKQKDLALFCGSVSGREKDKCSNLDLYKSPSGFWFLHGALASTACRIRESVDLDTHSVFLADILEGELEARVTHLRHLLITDL